MNVIAVSIGHVCHMNMGSAAYRLKVWGQSLTQAEDEMQIQADFQNKLIWSQKYILIVMVGARFDKLIR